jgi:hypothetical protein
MFSVSMPKFLPADDYLTTNSLLQLSCSQQFGMHHTKITAHLLLSPTFAEQTRLFAKPLLSNGCCIFAYLAVVVQ